MIHTLNFKSFPPIPESPLAYNASIFTKNGQDLLCYRSQQKIYGLSTCHICDTEGKYIQQLPQSMATMEDPRVAVVKDKIYVFSNSGSMTYPDEPLDTDYTICVSIYDFNYKLLGHH